MVEGGDVAQHRRHLVALVRERRTVRDLEDDQGRALGGLGEVLGQQSVRVVALAAGRGEVVGERSATTGGEDEDGAQDEDPARDGAPRVPRAGEGDAAGEPVHGDAFRRSWVLLLGREARQRCGERASPHVVSRRVIPRASSRRSDLRVSRDAPVPYARAESDAQEGSGDARPAGGDQAAPAPAAPRGRAAAATGRPAAARGRTPRSRWSRRRPGSGRRRCSPAGCDAGAAGAEDGEPVAWVSLDERDRRATSFWTYVLLALDRAVPGSGAAALTLLQSGQAPVEAVLAGVVNELSVYDGQVTLVLDDYHLADGVDVAEGMTFLVDHLPPQLRLVISTRADPALPLSRVRARGELVEIRAADLRFTGDEVATYLNELNGLGLAAADLTALENRTEGWVAALQLAALSLQDLDDPSAFIAGFAGDDRFVVDYLADEVLSRQPTDVRRFLLDTSILDRLTGPLCDAVSQLPDARTRQGDARRPGPGEPVPRAARRPPSLVPLPPPLRRRAAGTPARRTTRRRAGAASPCLRLVRRRRADRGRGPARPRRRGRRRAPPTSSSSPSRPCVATGARTSSAAGWTSCPTRSSTTDRCSRSG